jgi:tRNA-uridine 2-sulfurtransferase
MKTHKTKGFNRSRKKVWIGLSGGVDSAVSAALLKKQGFDVTGVFIKVWQPEFMECTWKDDRRDAMRVCAHLNIPFKTLDLEKEYKEEVVDYMIEEYKNGRTPNPDVMCNRYVKFGEFYRLAMKEGADLVATGHYAQILRCSTSQRKKMALGIINYQNLSISKDTNKDQTYFLWTIKQEQLSHIIFPIGNLTKPDVRAFANKFKLPNAEKKDSQGLCFVGKIDMKEFLSHFIKQREGDVLNESGEKVGIHPGSLFFTIGERHGFTIIKKSPNDKPYFVVSKDISKNTITVSSSHLTSADVKSNNQIKLKDLNWINEIPKKNKIYQAKVRYRGRFHNVKIETQKDEATVLFLEGAELVASGQSMVVYDGEVCLGGGIIE